MTATDHDIHHGELKGEGPCEDLTPEQLELRVTHRCARLVLGSFVFTFVIARILVILIMAHMLPPQLFFHVSDTHVHHLNYGIALLSISGGYLLFARPTGKRLSWAAMVYGLGLGLTFDEFGMWLHLGGPYWQRASFDAVVVVASVLAFISYASRMKRWHPKHHALAALMMVAVAAFGVMLYCSVMNWAGQQMGTMLDQLESGGPK